MSRYGSINTYSQATEMKAVLKRVLTELVAGGRLTVDKAEDYLALAG